jgi:hypothetical protein
MMTAPSHNTADAGEELFTPGVFAGMLAVLLAITFWPALSGDGALFYRDYGFLGYPFIHFHRESFWRGELPFWNPYVNCGAPFLAQWNTLALYPGSLLYLIPPLPWSLGFFCVAHLFLGGMGMYVLGVNWSGSRLAAAMAGVAFTFSGLMMSNHIYPNYLATFGWMPWLVLAMERAVRHGGRQIVVAALVGTMQMLTGAPELILLTWGFVAALVAAQAFQRRSEKRQSNAPSTQMAALRFIAVVLLVAGLTAVQMIPFFQLLAQSQRTSQFATTFWSFPTWGWADFLVPLFRCARTSQGTFVQAGQTFFPSCYLGIIPLLLAIAAIRRWRDPRVMVTVVVSVIVLFASMGERGPLYPLLRVIFPGMGFARYPVKFIGLLAFTVPLLACLGFGALRGSGRPARSLWVIVGALLAGQVLVLLWACWRPLRTDDWSATWQSAAVRAFFLAVFAIVFWRLATAKAAVNSAKIAAMALIVLAWLDVHTHAPHQVPTIPSAAFAPGLAERLHLEPRPAPGVSRAMLSPYAEAFFHRRMVPDFLGDFIGERLALWYNLNILEGIPKVNGASTLQVRQQFEVETALYNSGTNLPAALMDFLAVTHLTAPGELHTWDKRASAMPMVTAGQQPQFLDDMPARERLFEAAFNPRTEILLPKAAEGIVKAGANSAARILAIHAGAKRVVADVDTGGQSTLLTVAQSFYPSWTAEVDGTSVPVWRANYAFQAIEVGPGRHTVIFQVQDAGFRLGALGTLLSLAVCGGVWGRFRQREG